MFSSDPSTLGIDYNSLLIKIASDIVHFKPLQIFQSINNLHIHIQFISMDLAVPSIRPTSGYERKMFLPTKWMAESTMTSLYLVAWSGICQGPDQFHAFEDCCYFCDTNESRKVSMYYLWLGTPHMTCLSFLPAQSLATVNSLWWWMSFWTHQGCY